MRSKRKMTSAVKKVIAMTLAISLAWTSVPMSARAEAVSEVTVAANETGQVSENNAVVYSLADQISAEEKTKTYLANGTPFDMEMIKAGIAVYENGELYGLLSDAELFGKCSLTWMVESGDSYVVSESPVNAGNYRLDVVLSMDGTTEDATLEIPFVINKQEVTVGYGYTDLIAGLMVKEQQIVSGATAVIEGQGFAYVEDDPDTADVDESVQSDFAINVTVRDMMTGEALSEDTVITTYDYYEYTCEAVFTDRVEEEIRTNYQLTSEVRKNVPVLASAVNVKANLLGEWKEAGFISKVYDGTAISEPAEDVDYALEVSIQSGTVVGGENTEVEITTMWTDSKGAVLAEAPNEAGTYSYKVIATVKNGFSSTGTYDIPVKILPREVIVKPIMQENAAIYSGMTVRDVWEQYVDYTVWDVQEKKELDIDKELFWGTENNGAERYTPQFRIFWKSGESWSQQSDNTLIREGGVYQVRFSGYKMLCLTNGNYYSRNMSSGDCPILKNYSVKTDNDTLLANVSEFTAATIQYGVIDVSALYQEDMGEGNNTAITKEYDGMPLFDKESDYKKAVVNLVDVSGNKTELAGSEDSHITYQWEYKSGSYWYQYNCAGVSPVDAKQYRLKVSYVDNEKGYTANPQYVYYTITQKQYKVVPMGNYEAWTQTAVNDYDCTKIASEIYYIPVEGDPVKMDWGAEDYQVTWQIERAAVADATETYRVARGTTFEEGYNYRAVVTGLVVTSDQASNHAVNATESEAVPIHLRIMGSAELVLDVSANALISDTKEYDGKAFDITEALAAGMVQVNDARTGAVIENLELTYSWRDKNNYEVESPVEVGEYKLYVSYSGDETYQAIASTYVTTVNITKRKVNVTLTQKMPIYGGMTVNNVTLADYFVFSYDNLLEEDMGQELFRQKTYNMYRQNGNVIYSYQPLTSSESYTIVPTCVMNYTYNNRYELTYQPVEFTALMRPSKLQVVTEPVGDQDCPQVMFEDQVQDLHHTVSFVEGIPFNSTIGANCVSFVVEAKGDIYFNNSNVLYAKSIEKIGGWSSRQDNTHILVQIPITDKSDKEFHIYWKDGVVETFTLKFSEAVLLPNMSEAVSPKSISFLSPGKKMEVGTYQQLDVKYTKQQENDIIGLGYKSSNPDVLSVDMYGKVYAVGTGKADITVYPVKLTDGKLVEIQGGKTAKVTITVTGMATFKLNCTVKDNSAVVEWADTTNNSVYDIYLLEGKNKKAADFENAIASYDHAVWQGVFATAPELSKTTVGKDFYSLKPETDYTVCVVNKSVITKAGKEVLGDYTSMSVKSFRTTKPMLQGLTIRMDEKDVSWNTDLACYEVSFDKKKLTTTTWGSFVNPLTGYTEENKLPLSKQQQKIYQNPKLTYSITQGSAHATVDKKGVVKFKSAGMITLHVSDSLSGWSKDLVLRIKAEPTAVKGKVTKMQVGQSVALEDLLIYQQGKTVLKGEVVCSVQVDQALIDLFAANEYFDLDADQKIVTAVKAGGKMQVKLTDEVISAAGGSASATVTMQSQAIAPVKNLQIKNVTDTYFDVQFKNGGYTDTFKVEITDGRGKMIRSSALNGAYLFDEDLNCYSYRVYGLSRRTKYNVSVTAVCGTESSKAVKKSVTTTQMPASYVSLQDEENVGLYDSEAEYIAACWDGVDMRVRGGYDIYELENEYSGNYNSFAANNSYVLELYGNKLNEGAIAAGTDTLTWTSSNSKVAKIKATKGTAAATLTAQKSGTTVIEVKSKVTKAVIARYKLTIQPIGNGNLFYDGRGFEQLGLNAIKAVSIQPQSGQWVTFQAPSTGTYRVYSQNYSGGDPCIFYFQEFPEKICVTQNDYASCCTGYNDDYSGWNFSYTVSLKASQVVYFFMTENGMNNTCQYEVCVTRVN